MKPTIGQIVIYTPNESDKNLMRAAHGLNNGCNVQEKLPAIVTAVWSETCVNLRVICDGNLDLWKTSSLQGDKPMDWNYSTIVE